MGWRPGSGQRRASLGALAQGDSGDTVRLRVSRGYKAFLKGSRAHDDKLGRGPQESQRGGPPKKSCRVSCYLRAASRDATLGC